jgi:hypothetical protein
VTLEILIWTLKKQDFKIIRSMVTGLNSFNNLSSKNVLPQLINFIEEEIIAFEGSEQFINILIKKKNENQHSLAFCVYMTFKSNNKYYFARENAQKGSSVIDIGIYNKIGILLFTIEAKLLPIPIPNKKSERKEYEYVYGKGAGIQRFKEGKHGVDNMNNPLLENGLIAFVKENDFEHWYKKINQWILDANWDSSEQLQKVYFKTTAKFISNHPRINTADVKLHHFWVNV